MKEMSMSEPPNKGKMLFMRYMPLSRTISTLPRRI